MSKPFKEWDSFDIILAIVITLMFFPLSMIYWIIRSFQED